MKKTSQKNDYLFNCIEYLPFIIERGKGSFVWDTNGKKYLDLDSGQFCTIFGHTWPRLKSVVSNQFEKIIHTSTRALSPEVLMAAYDIHTICPEINAHTIFLSTGSEAVECAIRYAKNIQNKSGLICFDTGYHGLSLGSQSVTFGGEWAYPRVPNIFAIKAPVFHELSTEEAERNITSSLSDLEDILVQNSQDIAGLVMEPVISVGGMNFLPKEYCAGIAALCKKYDILLILDECQTGMGRTGDWFHYQYLGLIPDIVITAKALGAGFPVSAVIFKDSLSLDPNMTINHYSSHQNDPVSAAIVSAVIDEIKSKILLDKISEIGNYFLLQLDTLSSEYEFIKNPRGKGLMLGFDIYVDGAKSYREIGKMFSDLLIKEGIILQSTSQGKTYRILPNYLISKTEIDYFIHTMHKILKQNMMTR